MPLTDESSNVSNRVPALTIEGLTKSFLGNRVLTNVNLTVRKGEVHVLVGQNGSGKSTIIKLLSGYHRPDPGARVEVDGEPLELGFAEQAYRAGCRFVHQDLGLVELASIADNLAFGVGYPTRWGTIRPRSALASATSDLRNIGLELDPRKPVSKLGAAERTGVAIARALRDDRSHPPRVLVLDEPTATLPVDEVEHLLATLRQAAKREIGILYVTHHLEEALAIADRVTVLRDGAVVGTYDIASLSRDELVRQLVGDDIAAVQRVDVTGSGCGEGAVLSVERLSAGPLHEVSFRVMPGEIVGLAGLTGSGRESVLGAIFGATARDNGTVTAVGRDLPGMRPDLAVRRGIGYLSADRKGSSGIMSMSARENLTVVGLRAFWRWLHFDARAEIKESRVWLRKLDVRPRNAAEKPLATFSGGNQQKILFGKWLRQRPKLFLLDEPTQGVDIGAKAELHRALLQLSHDGAGIVISSTDTDELVAVCARVLTIHEGRVLAEFKDAELTHAAVMSSFMAEKVS